MQDNTAAKKPDDVKAKKSEEVQTHRGAETMNDSPEIMVLSQAAGSDGGATKPESTSEGETGNVSNYTIISNNYLLYSYFH